MKIEKYAILDTETGEMLPYHPKGKHKDKTIFAVYFPIQKTVKDYLIKYSTSTNIVEVKKYRAIEELGISERLYTKEISRLIKDNFCIRLAHDRYFINPERMIKGSRKNIMKLINFYKATKNDLREIDLDKKEKKIEYKQYAMRVERKSKENNLTLVKTA